MKNTLRNNALICSRVLMLLSGMLISGGAGLSASTFSVDNLPAQRMTVPIANERIKLDGLADDAVWERGAITYGFQLVEDGKSPKMDTRARLLYDRNNLYVAFTAYAEDPAALQSAAERKRDGDVNAGDAVGFVLEIETEGQAKRKIEVWVNAANTILDTDDTGDGSNWNVEGLSSAVFLREKSWDVEIVLPFKGLGVEAPMPGQVWKANFIRHRSVSAGGSAEVSRWSSKDDFGEIRFGRDLLVYLWSARPYATKDEVIVYNHSEVLRQLRVELISVTSGQVVAHENIYIGPGHRRQHFPMPAPDAGDYYLIVRQTDRPLEQDDVLHVQWRPKW